MARDKRKSRLEKGSGEFLGFGAFATAGAVSSPSSAASPTTTTPGSTLQQWSPVYTGSDAALSLLFRRIAQKRDGQTKSRALSELRDYFQQQDTPKREQVAALSHLAFVFHSKLAYDDFAAVRSAALACLQAAYERLPKAWNALIMEQQEGEIWGMAYCAQTDPTAEVRMAAEGLCRAIEMEQGEVPKEGVVPYVSRLLQYERPRNMHEALFARKMADAPKQQAMSESERDQLEERFERIVGTALSGMALWVSKHPEMDYQECFEEGLLWKTLSNSRSSFRRKTYALLATSCQHAGSLVYATEGLPKALTNVLTMEKEASNVPSLLEVLLLYLQRYPGEDVWKTMEPAMLARNLSKMLKKACHGASAKQWGPTMLPLLATFPNDSLAMQRQLLSSMWEGREAAIGPSDSLFIVAAVAECASFFLLRGEKEELDVDVAKELALLWCKTLGHYLSMRTPSMVAKEADRSLEGCLSLGLFQLDQFSYDKVQSVIYGIHAWFWSEIIPETIGDASGPESNLRLSSLLRGLVDHRKESLSLESRESRFHPTVRSMFHSTLAKYQGSSGSIPDTNAYDLMICGLNYCGALYVFEKQVTAIDQFLMNDILRWLVIHTSSHPISGRSDHQDNIGMNDFELLRICLLVLPEKRHLLWEAVLRELIQADCDVALLAQGLTVLAKNAHDGNTCLVDMLPCETLQAFALKVGLDVVSEHRCFVDKLLHAELEAGDQQYDSYVIDSKKLEVFLKTCLGLTEGMSIALVKNDILQKWVEALSLDRQDHQLSLTDPSLIENPLLSTLVSFVRQEGRSVSEMDATQILLASWRQGGNTWDRVAVDWLLKHTDATNMLVSEGSRELQDSVIAFCKSGSIDSAEIVLACHMWSERAHRILNLCRESNLDSNRAAIAVPSLRMVGLADAALWELAYSSLDSRSAIYHLYLCLICILEMEEAFGERLQLLLRSSEKPSALIVNMLVALSDADDGPIDPIRRKDRRVRHVLQLVGKPELCKDGVLESLCREAVDVASQESRSRGPRRKRALSVLSECVGLLFDRPRHTGSDSVNPNEILAGQTVWYLSDQADESKREKVEVIKVHTDDFPRLYFTIRLERNGETQERQTVAERFRKLESTSAHKPISEDEKRFRISLGETVVENLVRPVFEAFLEDTDEAMIESAAESTNIVVSQCGLYEKGIGSTHYNLFRWLSSLQSNVAEHLISREYPNHELIPRIRALSLSMGFGGVTPASDCNFHILGINPEVLSTAIVEKYVSDDGEVGIIEVDRAIVEWLTISMSHLENDKFRLDTAKLVPKLVTRLLQHRPAMDASVILSDSLLVMRGLEETRQCALRYRGMDTDSNDNEEQAICALILAFSTTWDSELPFAAGYLKMDTQLDEDQSEPLWCAPFESFLSKALYESEEVLRKSARLNSESLIPLLGDTQKRWFTFWLVEIASRATSPLYSADDVQLIADTERLLNLWQNGLEDEEKEELEEDLITVGRWIPRSLMTELQSWSEKDSDLDDDTAVSCMLSWLSLLPFIESSASADVVNRGCFSSYIEKCEALPFILDLMLDYLDMEKNRNSKQNAILTAANDILKDRRAMDLPSLAALVLFRTVEVFPSLTKHWVEEDCPKALSTAVCQFVESNVAPETLRRELKRIKNATDLGEMTVSGSLVSREVTATYTQDECQLSVIIAIPPAFPLRNVEVDCRKTLGVPEKRWKRWALQIRLMLNSQDGTLLDALMLWKENVDKEFEGVEPCPVCYSVLSVKSHELPKLECKTCKNRFHTKCLYQWFHTSGKSQCVICQQPWSGTRIQ